MALSGDPWLCAPWNNRGRMFTSLKTLTDKGWRTSGRECSTPPQKFSGQDAVCGPIFPSTKNLELTASVICTNRYEKCIKHYVTLHMSPASI